MRKIWLMTLILLTGSLQFASAQDAVRPGNLIIDPPTLVCLGFAWEIEGDANRNAAASVKFRKMGQEAWREALPLLRVGDFHAGRTSDWLDVKTPPCWPGAFLTWNRGLNMRCASRWKIPTESRETR